MIKAVAHYRLTLFKQYEGRESRSISRRAEDPRRHPQELLGKQSRHRDQLAAGKGPRRGAFARQVETPWHLRRHSPPGFRRTSSRNSAATPASPRALTTAAAIARICRASSSAVPGGWRSGSIGLGSQSYLGRDSSDRPRRQGALASRAYRLLFLVRLDLRVDEARLAERGSSLAARAPEASPPARRLAEWSGRKPRCVIWPNPTPEPGSSGEDAGPGGAAPRKPAANGSSWATIRWTSTFAVNSACGTSDRCASRFNARRPKRAPP